MFEAIQNVFVAILKTLNVWAEGLWALIRLIGIGAKASFSGGDIKTNLAAAFAPVSNQRLALSVLRAFVPNLVLTRQIVKAYENTGTVVVTRHDDCLDVLNRNDDFEVVYGSRMRKLTEGHNFFLGMQPGWDYTRDTSAMHLAMRMSDVPVTVQPRASDLATSLVAQSDGKIDIVPGLTLQVPWDMTDTYFGVGGPDAAVMQEWTTTLFWYLFEDLAADPEFDARAMKDAGKLRDYLDSAIKDRKANPTTADDVLNRCLKLQGAGTPGMDDLGIRNNLLGLLIGAIPTISKASCFAMDELLNRPDKLRQAQAAAAQGDDAILAQYIWEALRFNPHNPVIYRRAIRDAVIAPSTLRARTAPKGSLVFAATLSATFDPLVIPNPGEFRTNRSWGQYIIWGYGMHTCFGAAINEAIIPAILKPLLARPNLRRAPGAAGRIDMGGTPHPQHFHLEFDN